jgi:hypothetical protein
MNKILIAGLLLIVAASASAAEVLKVEKCLSTKLPQAKTGFVIKGVKSDGSKVTLWSSPSLIGSNTYIGSQVITPLMLETCESIRASLIKASIDYILEDESAL